MDAKVVHQPAEAGGFEAMLCEVILGREKRRVQDLDE